MPSSKKQNYKPQLDTLRAVAVLAVMASHFLPVKRYLPEDFISLGLLGVRLFFVLSGYLITGILLQYREYQLKAALKKFYIRRVLRIFPIYYLTLSVLFFIGVTPIRQYAYWHYAYLSNILFVLYDGSTAANTGHFWSLSVEEQFYIFWPFLMLFTPYKHLKKLILGIISSSRKGLNMVYLALTKETKPPCSNPRLKITESCDLNKC